MVWWFDSWPQIQVNFTQHWISDIKRYIERERERDFTLVHKHSLEPVHTTIWLFFCSVFFSVIVRYALLNKHNSSHHQIVSQCGEQIFPKLTFFFILHFTKCWARFFSFTLIRLVLLHRAHTNTHAHNVSLDHIECSKKTKNWITQVCYPHWHKHTALNSLVCFLPN